MKSWIRALCLVISLLLLAACGSSPQGQDPTAPVSPTEPPRQGTASQEALYQQLFDIRNRLQLRLIMEPRQVALLQKDYETYSSRGSKSPIYRMADLELTITNPRGISETYFVPQVGVRMKGNTSRTSFYSPEDGVYNLIHLKLSFQETFDEKEYYGAEALEWTEAAREQRKDRTFATLEKLDMKWNKNDDATYIREHYAYEMYRDAGVLAPRTNLAALDWQGQLYAGLYTIYEPVDKVFLERNLPKRQQGGDLYKCGWSHTGASFTSIESIGIENEDRGEFFAYDLKTNKKKSKHEDLTNLITRLGTGEVTKEQFQELVDVESFIAYAAVSYLAGNPDDLRNNYNNFYLYFLPDSGKARIIPYDFDRCFGITKDWNPTGDGLVNDSPFSTSMAANGAAQANPLYIYSVCQGGYYMEPYARTLKELAQSKWMDPAWFEAIYNIAKTNYEGLTQPSKEVHNGKNHCFAFDLEQSNGANLSFESYVTQKLKTLNHALENRDSSIDPQVPEQACYIRGDFNNWELQEAYRMESDPETGGFVFQVEGRGELRLKVYSKLDDRWLGTEALDPENTVSCKTDGHGNIVFPAGSYKILYFPTQKIIQLIRL